LIESDYIRDYHAPAAVGWVCRLLGNRCNWHQQAKNYEPGQNQGNSVLLSIPLHNLPSSERIPGRAACTAPGHFLLQK
jgi:hypothetical protein